MYHATQDCFSVILPARPVVLASSGLSRWLGNESSNKMKGLTSLLVVK